MSYDEFVGISTGWLDNLQVDTQTNLTAQPRNISPSSKIWQK